MSWIFWVIVGWMIINVLFVMWLIVRIHVEERESKEA